MESGDERTIEVEAPGDSGFFLKTVGYGDWKGHKHGRFSAHHDVDAQGQRHREARDSTCEDCDRRDQASA